MTNVVRFPEVKEMSDREAEEFLVEFATADKVVYVMDMKKDIYKIDVEKLDLALWAAIKNFHK